MQRRKFIAAAFGAPVALAFGGATTNAFAETRLRASAPRPSQSRLRAQGAGQPTTHAEDPEWWGDFCEDLGGGASSQSDGRWRCANSGGTTLTASPDEENSTQPE